MVDLAVLGAGPAGLGAAYRAARRGFEVVVCERDDHVGGLASSFEVGGLRVDHGSHRLHPATEPRVLDELQELLGSDLQRRHRHGRIRLQGRWLRFPLRPADLLRRLPPRFAAGAAVDAATSWARRPRADTFAEHLRAGLGPTMCEGFYFPYARKLWGLEPDQLNGEQARRRVRAATPARLLRRVVRGGSGDGHTFYYPRRGYGQLGERLAEAAVDAGVDLRLGSAAQLVRPDDDGVDVITDAGALRAATVWSTVPMPALAGLIDPPAPTAVRAAAGSLQHRAMLLVYLVLDADRYTEFDAHYLPETWTPVTRVSEPKNYRDADDDPRGVTVLCAEVPCARGDATWQLSDADAGELAAEALTGSGLAPPPVVDVTVRRIPQVYPVYQLGFADHVARLDTWVGSHPNLLTFGRQGLFVHDNAHHALAMAWAAADALTDDGRVDAAAWSRSRAAFRAHVVED